MFDPEAGIPQPNRSLIYFGACIIARLRLARENRVHVRMVSIITAIDESVELSQEISKWVFCNVPGSIVKKYGVN